MHWLKPLQLKLKVISIIFTLVGWFLLITVLLEDVFEQDLSSLETFMQTSAVTWSIQLFALGLIVVLLRYKTWVEEKLLNSMFYSYLTYGGIAGWIIAVLSYFLFH